MRNVKLNIYICCNNSPTYNFRNPLPPPSIQSTLCLYSLSIFRSILTAMSSLHCRHLRSGLVLSWPPTSWSRIITRQFCKRRQCTQTNRTELYILNVLLRNSILFSPLSYISYHHILTLSIFLNSCTRRQYERYDIDTNSSLFENTFLYIQALVYRIKHIYEISYLMASKNNNDKEDPNGHLYC